MTQYKLKRAYDKESPDDGFRVYIDRLWPRGLSHENFHYDLWEKQISPSTELREWFHEDPTDRWNEFVRKYKDELRENPDFKSFKELLETKAKVTLLYSSHDETRNNAVVVEEMLKD